MIELNETILQACAYLNNYFVHDTEVGDFSLKDNQIALKGDYPIGAWLLLSPGVGIYRISARQGNVYTVKRAENIEHSWTGQVYRLNLPFAFVRLCERINAWQNSEQAQPTNLAGERLADGYSWTAAEETAWQDMFKKDLAVFPKQPVTGVKV